MNNTPTPSEKGYVPTNTLGKLWCAIGVYCASLLMLPTPLIQPHVINIYQID
jgi:hypothetical protein